MTLYLPPCAIAGCNSVGIIGDSAPRLCWRHANEAAGVVIVAPSEPPPKGRPMRTEGRPWTTTEERRLREMWAKGVRSSDIGKVLDRTGDQVGKRARRLGLPKRSTHTTTGHE